MRPDIHIEHELEASMRWSKWIRSRRSEVLWAGVVAAAALGAVGAEPAQASFHLWEIDEVYSDAAGNVQFIEFFNQFDGENFLSGSGGLTSNTETFSFASNLPVGESTVNKHFLVATQAYAALTGAPTPDYVIPNQFFSVDGDTLTLEFSDNGTITFTGAQLPTDGLLSLNRAYGSSTTSGFTTATNSPTNFAGDTGVVPEPSTFAVMLLGAAAIAGRRRSRARPA